MKKYMLGLILSLSLAPVKGQLIYALWEDPGTSIYHLVTIDPRNGTMSQVGSIPTLTGLVIPGTSSLNPLDSTYSFMGNTLGGIRLFQIDINTGFTLNNNAFGDNVVGHQFNCIDSTIYAIFENSGAYSFVTVDPAAGTKTVIAPLANVSAHLGASFNLDVQNGLYNFQGLHNGNLSMLSVDIFTGNIVASNTFSDNVVAQRYDCRKDTTFGLWEEQSNGTYHLVWVDPSAGMFTVRDTLPGVTPGFISESFANYSDSNWLVYLGYAPSLSVVTIDVNTGAIIRSIPFTQNAAGYEMMNCCSVDPVVANFFADDTVLVAGDTVNFTDLSSGPVTSWNWTLTGGAPSSSILQHPTNIVYNNQGCYDVTLVVSSAYSKDTMKRSCYIDVDGGPSSISSQSDTKLAVWPTKVERNGLLHARTIEEGTLEVYNVSGVLLETYNLSKGTHHLEAPDHDGLLIYRFISGSSVSVGKLFVN